MAYDAWLEDPYERAAEAAEMDDWAQEHGYDDYQDYMECLADYAGDRKYSENKERPYDDGYDYETQPDTYDDY